MAYLSLREMNLTLVGFVDDGQRESFLSYPVWKPDALSDWEFDAVLLADLGNTETQIKFLRRLSIPEEKILALGPSA
jgi:hypothetical protein